MSTPNPIDDIIARLDQDPELQAALRARIIGDLQQAVQQNQEMITAAMEQQLKLYESMKEAYDALAHTVSRLSTTLIDLTEVVNRHENRLTQVEADVAELKAGQRMILERLDRIEGDIAGMKGDIKALKAGQAKMEGDISDLKAGQAKMKGDIAGMKGDIAGMKGDIAGMKGDIAGMKGDIAGMKGDIAGMKGDIAGMKGDIAGMKGDIAGMKGDIAGMKGDIAGMKGDIAGMKGDIAGMKGDISDLKAGQARMAGQIGNLHGRMDEADVHAKIASIFYRRLQLEDPNVLMSRSLPHTPELQSILRTASRNGDITPEERGEALDADLIATAEDADGNIVIVVAEVASRLDDYDITRAAQRARIMGAATGQRRVALAIATGATPEEPQLRLAAQQDVTVIDLSPQRPRNRPETAVPGTDSRETA